MQLSAADKATLFRELGKLITAGFHLDRSVALLLGQNPPPARRAFLDGLQRGLARGEGIASSIAQENAALVSGLDLSLITAGEASGRLAEPFEHLARYYEAVDAGLRQALGALIYPLILAHLGIVLPAVPELVAGGEAAAILTGVLVRLGLFWVAIFIGWRLWLLASATALRSAEMDRWLGRLPWIGPVRRHWALARFTQVFHAGLLAAMRMTQITRMAGEAAQSGLLQAGAESAAARLELGDPLASSLRASGAFPQLFTDSVATAEEAGSVDKEMARWAAAETELAAESMRRLALWLPKLGYTLVVLYVAWRIINMVLGIYQPLFDVMKES